MASASINAAYEWWSLDDESSNTGLIFRVDDVRAEFERIRALGAEVPKEPAANRTTA